MRWMAVSQCNRSADTVMSYYCTSGTTSKSDQSCALQAASPYVQSEQTIHFYRINNPPGARPSAGPHAGCCLSMSQVTTLVWRRVCAAASSSKHSSHRSLVCGVLSLVEALCVARNEFDSGRELSDDVCAAHELCEHVAVLGDIRIKQTSLWRGCGGGTAASAASSSG